MTLGGYDISELREGFYWVNGEIRPIKKEETHETHQ